MNMRRIDFFPIVLALLFAVLMSAFSLWKFYTFQHDALDLAIFLQTISESANGNWFGLTIHPHSYLGDHVALLLVIPIALFKLIPQAETLLVLQALVLGLSVLPFYAIAKTALNKKWARIFSLVYIAYPSIWNIAAFEFHAFAFAPLLILLAALAYQKSAYAWYVLAVLFMLALREDMTLVVFGFSAVALLDRRAIRWWLPIMALAIAWFGLTTELTQLFSSYDQYKFFVYYQWLGSTAQEIVWNAVTNPLDLVLHLLHPTNLLFYAALFLPLALVPLVRPKWLLICVLPILALVLNSGGAIAAVLFTHHTAIIAPGILLATIFGMKQLLDSPPTWFARLQKTDGLLLKALGVCIPVYAFITLTPLMHFVPFRDVPYSRVDQELAEGAITLVHEGDRVASTFVFLPHVADRAQVHSLHYGFIGHMQYAFDSHYAIEDADTVLIDTDEILNYPIYFFQSEDQRNVLSGHERLQSTVSELRLTALTNNVLAFSRNGSARVEELWGITPTNNTGPMQFEISSFAFGAINAKSLTTRQTLDVQLTTNHHEQSDEFVHPLFRFHDASGDVISGTLLPMAYGFYPTPAWAPQTRVTTRYRLIVPPNAAKLSVQLTSIDGTMGINDVRSGELLKRELQYYSPESVLDISDVTDAPAL